MKVIPEEVLAVERPDNTQVVHAHGRFVVRIILGKRKSGKNRLGAVVGYIINLQFMPKAFEYKKPDPEKPYMVSYGSVALILMVAMPFLAALTSVFPITIAMQIFIVACLKVIYPGVSSQYLRKNYNKSYLSVCFPKVGLSRGIVSDLYKEVGLSEKSRIEYYKQRLQSIINEFYVIYIDGTHKQLTITIHRKYRAMVVS